MQSVAVTDADDLQDPFEITYNVARTVTKDGLYTVSRYANCYESPYLPRIIHQIRGEFMRATRVCKQVGMSL